MDARRGIWQVQLCYNVLLDVLESSSCDVHRLAMYAASECGEALWPNSRNACILDGIRAWRTPDAVLDKQALPAVTVCNVWHFGEVMFTSLSQHDGRSELLVQIDHAASNSTDSGSKPGSKLSEGEKLGLLSLLGMGAAPLHLPADTFLCLHDTHIVYTTSFTRTSPYSQVRVTYLMSIEELGMLRIWTRVGASARWSLAVQTNLIEELLPSPGDLTVATTAISDSKDKFNSIVDAAYMDEAGSLLLAVTTMSGGVFALGVEFDVSDDMSSSDTTSKHDATTGRNDTTSRSDAIGRSDAVGMKDAAVSVVLQVGDAVLLVNQGAAGRASKVFHAIQHGDAHTHISVWITLGCSITNITYERRGQDSDTSAALEGTAVQRTLSLEDIAAEKHNCNTAPTGDIFMVLHAACDSYDGSIIAALSCGHVVRVRAGLGKKLQLEVTSVSLRSGAATSQILSNGMCIFIISSDSLMVHDALTGICVQRIRLPQHSWRFWRSIGRDDTSISWGIHNATTVLKMRSPSPSLYASRLKSIIAAAPVELLSAAGLVDTIGQPNAAIGSAVAALFLATFDGGDDYLLTRLAVEYVLESTKSNTLMDSAVLTEARKSKTSVLTRARWLCSNIWNQMDQVTPGLGTALKDLSHRFEPTRAQRLLDTVASISRSEISGMAAEGSTSTRTASRSHQQLEYHFSALSFQLRGLLGGPSELCNDATSTNTTDCKRLLSAADSQLLAFASPMLLTTEDSQACPMPTIQSCIKSCLQTRKASTVDTRSSASIVAGSTENLMCPERRASSDGITSLMKKGVCVPQEDSALISAMCLDPQEMLLTLSKASSNHAASALPPSKAFLSFARLCEVAFPSRKSTTRNIAPGKLAQLFRPLPNAGSPWAAQTVPAATMIHMLQASGLSGAALRFAPFLKAWDLALEILRQAEEEDGFQVGKHEHFMANVIFQEERPARPIQNLTEFPVSKLGDLATLGLLHTNTLLQQARTYAGSEQKLKAPLDEADLPPSNRAAVGWTEASRSSQRSSNRLVAFHTLFQVALAHGEAGLIVKLWRRLPDDYQLPSVLATIRSVLQSHAKDYRAADIPAWAIMPALARLCDKHLETLAAAAAVWSRGSTYKSGTVLREWGR